MMATVPYAASRRMQKAIFVLGKLYAILIVILNTTRAVANTPP